MHGPIDREHWEVRMAYKKGWEERLAYYDKLLRSLLELLEGALHIMKVDELSEEMQCLGRAVVEIEDAWCSLALKKVPSQVTNEGIEERERERERESKVEVKVTWTERQLA